MLRCALQDGTYGHLLNQLFQGDAAARLLVALYSPRPARVSPMECNLAWARDARGSARRYFITEDAASDRDLDEIIWKATRGENTLMPAPRRRAFRKLETRQKKDGNDYKRRLCDGATRNRA